MNRIAIIVWYSDGWFIEEVVVVKQIFLNIHSKKTARKMPFVRLGGLN